MKKMLEMLKQQGIIISYYRTGGKEISIELYTGEIVDIRIGDKIEINSPQKIEIMNSYSDMFTYLEGYENTLKTFNF